MGLSASKKGTTRPSYRRKVHDDLGLMVWERTRTYDVMIAWCSRIEMSKMKYVLHFGIGKSSSQVQTLAALRVSLDYTVRSRLALKQKCCNSHRG